MFWLLFGADTTSASELNKRIQVPDGFRIELFASGIRGARMLRFSPLGELYVSFPSKGAIYRVSADGDVEPVVRKLTRPHGIDFYDGWLYIAETGRIKRVRLEQGHVVGAPETIVSGIPAGGQHWTRSLRFGPDGWMYVSIGSSCNVCNEQDPRRAAIVRYRADGTGEEVFATGLRNSVGFDWHPETKQLFATDNGRDLLGDDMPPCEFNRIVKGAFYGWPFANGDRLPDPDFGKGKQAEIKSSEPPAHGFGAHTAPLGMLFYRGDGFPAQYRNRAFVAQHGSWNRSRKVGYQVVSLSAKPDGGFEEKPFVWGFERNEDVIGRPVDIAEGPDGALYISDDYAGAIYRVSYAGVRSETDDN